jgi:2-iminobutanoate/2-iminopropanoate deaminase
MKIEHHNPPALHRNPAFTQVVTVEGAAKLIFVGGQNAVDAQGNVVGDDLATQTTQALGNVLAALTAVRAGPQHVVRLAIYLTPDRDPKEAFAAAQKVWGAYPAAITVLKVAGLAHPRFLVEIEATAAVDA